MRCPTLCALPIMLSTLACSSSPTGTDPNVTTGIGVVNAFASSVDLLVDGATATTGISPGTFSSVTANPGKHTVSLRPTAGGSAVGVEMKVVDGRVVSVAATSAAGGALFTASLEDTNAVVPAGATKLRVLHLAALTGEVQVWRTQPDWSTPIRWQFPFTYSPTISAIGNPYFQSTVGTWDVRVWTDTTIHHPGDPALWATPLDAVTIALGSGEKKTVVILDKPGGGVKFMVIE